MPFNLQNYVFGVRYLVPALRLSDLSGDHPGHGNLRLPRRTRQGCGERRRFRQDVKMGPLRHRAAGTVVVVRLVTRKAMAKLKEAGLDDRNPG